MGTDIIKAYGLTKRYGNTFAVNDLNIQIPEGKVIGILGPNGSGKTTFLKMCAGLLLPTSGSLMIDGHKIGVETKKCVAYLPDRTYLSNGQTIKEQFDFFEDFYEDFDRVRAEAMLLDLRIDINAKFGVLSKGNKEKVQLILVMARNARVYLLDEPIGGVDPVTRDYILRTIIANRNPGSTVVISTHLISDVESVLDEFYFINFGHIIRQAAVKMATEETGKTVNEIYKEVFGCF